MRIYISGKMTGCPDLNRPAFFAATARLTAQGHFVINPHKLTPIFGTAEVIEKAFKEYYLSRAEHWNEFEKRNSPAVRLAESVMDANLAAVRSCDAIYLLRGWEKSRGAKKELAEVLAHGLKVMQEGGEE